MILDKFQHTSGATVIVVKDLDGTEAISLADDLVVVASVGDREANAAAAERALALRSCEDTNIRTA